MYRGANGVKQSTKVVAAAEPLECQCTVQNDELRIICIRVNFQPFGSDFRFALYGKKYIGSKQMILV